MKMLLKIIAVLLVLVIVAAIILPMVIDPNDYREEIAAVVKEQTGRELKIAGDISLTVFPWLGAELGVVELANAPGFKPAVFARTEKVAVRVKLMPLLKKRVEMDTVTIHGLQLNLARDAKGRSNWDDLVAKGGEAKTDKVAPAGQSEPPALAALAIGGVDLSNASIHWDDAQAGQRYQINKLALSTGALGGSDPVDLELSFALEGAIAGQVEASGRLQLDAGKLALSGFGLKVQLAGEGLGGGSVEAQLNADLLLDQVKQQLALNGLKVEVTKLHMAELSGALSFSGSLQGDLEKQRFSAPGLALSGALEGKALPAGKVELQFGADVTADLGAQTLGIEKLALQIAGLNLDGGVQVSKLLDGPRYKGKLHAAPFSPRELLARLGQEAPETADPKVLGMAELEASLSGSTDAVQLASLRVRLDDTTLKGTASVQHFAKPAIRFQLDADALDADRYLPPESAASAQTVASPGAAAAGGATELPLEALRALDVDGKITLGKLTVRKLKLQNISLAIKGRDGLIGVTPAAQLYQGSYKGNIGLDARGKQPKLRLDEKLSGVQIGPLLDDLQDGKGKLTGTTNLQARLSATGADPEAAKKTLGGDVRFSLSDGAVKGVNVARLIREAQAKLQGRSLPADSEPLQTDFAALDGTVQIDKGIATNRDLLVKSPLLRVEGSGTVDLPQEQLNYGIKTTLVATSKGQGGKELANLSGVPIPIRITGSFADPKYGVDMNALMNAKAKAVVSQQKAKVQEKVQEKLQKSLGDKAGGLLKGLFR